MYGTVTTNERGGPGGKPPRGGNARRFRPCKNAGFCQISLRLQFSYASIPIFFRPSPSVAERGKKIGKCIPCGCRPIFMGHLGPVPSGLGTDKMRHEDVVRRAKTKNRLVMRLPYGKQRIRADSHREFY